MIWTVAAMLALAGAASATTRSYDLLDAPVAVVAVLTEGGDGADTFAIQVGGDPDCVLTSSLIAVGDLDEAVAVLRRGVRVRGGFLFIRTECGGGNAWNCETESVFALADGRATYLGDVVSGGRDEVGTAGGDSLFTSRYDRLEGNRLTSHADAPGFLVYSRPGDGRLVPDLDHTWLANRGPDRLEALRRSAADLPGDRDGGRRLGVEVLSVAALARYCGRDQALAEARILAARVLPPAMAGNVDALLDQVIPGESPPRNGCRPAGSPGG